jgi:acyl carrier protein
LSINWGPWAEVGLATEKGRGERLAERGIGSITRPQGVALFERLLKSYSLPQVAVMAFDFEQWSRSRPAVSCPPLFAEMAGRFVPNRPATEGKGVSLNRDELLAADRPQRSVLLESYLTALLARVLGFGKSQFNKLDTNLSINRLGLDSLMALEMKTRIEADLGIVIPIVNFLKGVSIAQLSAKVLDQFIVSAPILKARAASAATAAATEQWEELNI